MPRHERIFRVFVSSPSDVIQEREALEEVVAEVNSTLRKGLGLSFELAGWESDVISGLAAEPQELINNEIGDDYDIFIGIMWGRFGTPTKAFGSGTEEEYRLAFERWKSDPDSVRVMFYFKEGALKPSEIDPMQLSAVQAFKKEVGSIDGLFYLPFNDTEHFAKILRMHLSKLAQSYADLERETPERPSSNLTQKSDFTISAGVADSDTEILLPDQDLGYLDLLEDIEESIAECTQVSERMAAAMSDIGDATNERTRELESLKKDGQIVNIRDAKKVFKRSSRDLDTLSERLEADIPKFLNCNLKIVKSASDMAGVVGDFSESELDELREIIEMLSKFIEPFGGFMESIDSFRTVLKGMARVSLDFNRSRNRATAALDRLILASDESVSVAEGARSLIIGLADRLVNE